jgi:hypothetical protein
MTMYYLTKEGKVSMNKRYFATLVFGIAFMVAANVRADIVSMGELITTGDVSHWSVAFLGAPDTSFYNNYPGITSSQRTANQRNNAEYDAVWNEGVKTSTGTTVYNSYGERYDDGYKSGYSSAKAVGNNGTQYNWGQYGDWISFNNTGTYNNGYYSFVTTVNDVLGLDFGGDWSGYGFNSLYINFAADDHLEAIIINGQLANDWVYGADKDGNAVQVLPQDPKYKGWLSGVVAVDLAGFNFWDVHGDNTIEFIVHNNGSTTNLSPNPTGFYAEVQASYWFTPGGTIIVLPDDDPRLANTPEPATIAILGLGLAGLGLVRARRRK